MYSEAKMKKQYCEKSSNCKTVDTAFPGGQKKLARTARTIFVKGGGLDSDVEITKIFPHHPSHLLLSPLPRPHRRGVCVYIDV